MTEGVKDGVGDNARIVARPENPDLVLTLERLRRRTEPRGHIREWCAGRKLRNDLANLSARTCVQELDDGDETNREKNTNRHKYSEDFGETLHVCDRPNAAGQWRGADVARCETETLSARPLHQPV